MRAVAGKAKGESGGARGASAAASAGRPGLILVLLALLAGHVGLALLPDGIPATRVAGLSALWWYAGLLAPVLAAVTAVLLAPADVAPPRAEREDRR